MDSTSLTTFCYFLFNPWDLYWPSFSEIPTQNVLSRGIFSSYKMVLSTFLLCALSVQIHAFNYSFLCFFWSPALESVLQLFECVFFSLYDCEPFEYLCLCVLSICCAVTLPHCHCCAFLKVTEHTPGTHSILSDELPTCRWLQNNLPCVKGIYDLIFSIC